MLIGVAVAALTAVTVPATAASRAANCPAGSVCVYSGPDGGGNLAGPRVCVEPVTTVNVVGRFASHRWVDRC